MKLPGWMKDKGMHGKPVMTVSTFYCTNRAGLPKEAFPSERAARKALARKRRFRNRRYPHPYHCPDCRGYHLTGSVT